MTVNTRTPRAFRCDDTTWQWVEFIARQRGVRPSDVMREAVTDYTRRYREQPAAVDRQAS